MPQLAAVVVKTVCLHQPFQLCFQGGQVTVKTVEDQNGDGGLFVDPAGTVVKQVLPENAAFAGDRRAPVDAGTVAVAREGGRQGRDPIELLL